MSTFRVGFKRLTACGFAMMIFIPVVAISSNSTAQSDGASGRTYRVDMPGIFGEDSYYVTPWIGETFDVLEYTSIGGLIVQGSVFFIAKWAGRPIKP
jgi:hypothetical protein